MKTYTEAVLKLNEEIYNKIGMDKTNTIYQYSLPSYNKQTENLTVSIITKTIDSENSDVLKVMFVDSDGKERGFVMNYEIARKFAEDILNTIK